MEYCNGGSLATLIEEPENIYGLQQKEFLLVLKHISEKKIEKKNFNFFFNLILISMWNE